MSQEVLGGYSCSTELTPPLPTGTTQLEKRWCKLKYASSKPCRVQHQVAQVTDSSCRSTAGSTEDTCRDMKDIFQCRHNPICTPKFSICIQQPALPLLLQHAFSAKNKVFYMHVDMSCREGHFWTWSSKLSL